MQSDDPRLRDWVAGRLAPAAAAEVERIVRGSAELTRVVDELRAAAGGAAEDDVEVAAEWRQIERERIAAERAEAREDVESLARDAAAGRRVTNWPLVAMVAALVAGVVLAVLVNGRIDAARKQQAAAVDASGREAAFLEPAGSGSDEGPAGPGQLPTISAADAPPEGLGVRLRLRDERSRLLLEDLLAGSELRIGGDEEGDEAVPERLTARGVPAAVDALLAALARRSDHFSMEPFAVQAAPPAPGAAAGTVRLVLEILDEPAPTPAGGAEEPLTGQQ
jgi:hypothetical protein